MQTLFKDPQNNFRGIDEFYTFNEYFTYDVGDEQVLLTTRHRAWVVLTKEEYGLVRAKRVHEDPALYKTLINLNIILTKGNIKNAAKQYGDKYEFTRRAPSLHIVVPTHRCNLVCAYCHARSHPNACKKETDMDEDLAKMTIDFMFSIPRGGYKQQNVEIQGGEALLRWDICQYMIEYTKKKSESLGWKKPSFVIGTNLTLMDKDILGEIDRDFKQGYHWNISSSLDGPRHIHNAHRKYPNGKGSYDDVIYWIRLLKSDYPHLFSSCIPTVTKAGIGHEKEIINEYLKHKLTNIKLRHVNFTGRTFDQVRAGRHDLFVNAEEYFNFWKKCVEYVISVNKKGTYFVETTAQIFLNHILTIRADYMCIRKPCGAGISQLEFNYDGTIHACDGARSVEHLKLGNVREHKYNEIITSDKCRIFRQICSESLPKCVDCAWGAYCGYCIGRGLNQHGNLYPKMMRDFECQLFGRQIPYLFKKLMDPKEREILMKWV